jgi:N-acetylglucosamine-6-sulfatase
LETLIKLGQEALMSKVENMEQQAQRQWPLSAAIMVLAVELFFGSGCAVPRTPELAKPNIIFILTDDQDLETLAHMPRVQALLVKQGLTFRNSFVTMSLCCPSRSSILTGQYPHNHNILNNAPPLGGFVKFRDLGRESSTVATWLRTVGYRTALFGKYLNGYPTADNPTYVPPGWDGWYGKFERGPDIGDYFGYKLNENGRVVAYGKAPSDYLTDVLVEKAVAFIQSAAGDRRQPIFLYFAPYAPHAEGAPNGPPTPAPRHKGTLAHMTAPRSPSFNEADMSDKPSHIQGRPVLNAKQIDELDHEYRTRVESLLAVDEGVERILKALMERGELANSYIFFMSDNGYLLGQHRIPRGKNQPYEESIRVPLVVRGPGVPAGQSADHFALNIDFAPTIAELAGAPIRPSVDGRSLVPLLRGAKPPLANWRQDFLVESYTQPEAPPTVQSYFALRTQDTLYVEYASGERELYDLKADPYQLSSLHKVAGSERMKALSNRLSKLKSCDAKTCRD